MERARRPLGPGDRRRAGTRRDARDGRDRRDDGRRPAGRPARHPRPVRDPPLPVCGRDGDRPPVGRGGATGDGRIGRGRAVLRGLGSPRGGGHARTRAVRRRLDDDSAARAFRHPAPRRRDRPGATGAAPARLSGDRGVHVVGRLRRRREPHRRATPIHPGRRRSMPGRGTADHDPVRPVGRVPRRAGRRRRAIGRDPAAPGYRRPSATAHAHRRAALLRGRSARGSGPGRTAQPTRARDRPWQTELRRRRLLPARGLGIHRRRTAATRRGTAGRLGRRPGTAPREDLGPRVRFRGARHGRAPPKRHPRRPGLGGARRTARQRARRGRRGGNAP